MSRVKEHILSKIACCLLVFVFVFSEFIWLVKADFASLIIANVRINQVNRITVKDISDEVKEKNNFFQGIYTFFLPKAEAVAFGSSVVIPSSQSVTVASYSTPSDIKTNVSIDSLAGTEDSKESFNRDALENVSFPSSDVLDFFPVENYIKFSTIIPVTVEKVELDLDFVFDLTEDDADEPEQEYTLPAGPDNGAVESSDTEDTVVPDTQFHYESVNRDKGESVTGIIIENSLACESDCPKDITEELSE